MLFCLNALQPQAQIPRHLTQPKRSQALPHTNHPHSKVDNFIRPSNKLAVAINPSRCRATRPSAPSKSLPKLSVRTAPSPSGSVCAPTTPSDTTPSADTGVSRP
ncbi:unnamed protein product [Penicillium egyptiacum]|uniref:Uncharacterized protein n=1 Tax=Penicillium egyptiacum TaxID=1303716 RepID=A0A9W4K7K9_9EURO|nr:unnamed protein product [Penicillium egyptiacum]